MLKSLSLSIKLPIAILAVILITLSVSTVYIISTAEDVILYVKSNIVENLSLDVGNSLSTQLQKAGKDIVLVAGLPTVLEGLQLSPDSSSDGDDDSLKRANLTILLQRVMVSFGYYEEFYLSNSLGSPLAGNYKNKGVMSLPRNKEWMNEILLKWGFGVGEPYRSRVSDNMVLPVALKVVYDDSTGVLVGVLELSEITFTLMNELARPGLTPYVVSSNGVVLSALERGGEGELSFGAEPWFSELLNKESGSVDVYWQGEMQTIGFYHIPQTDIYSIVIADEAYMSSYVSTIKKATVGAGLLTALLTVICVGLFIFPVTRDIKRLSHFAGEITQGSEKTDTGVKREDELGYLSDNLAKMVHTLKEMLQRAEAATRAKSEFLARMSHEIRTPLNGVIGMTYLALRNKPDPVQVEYLQRINNAANTLLEVINDILDFSKMEVNKMDIKNASFSLSATLQSVYDLMLIKSQEKDLEFSFKVADDVPDTLRGDTLRLAQILINICANALKFTEEGSVKLNVTIKSRKGSDLELLFAVADTGIGISKKAQATIFDSFSQVDGSTTRQYGGTGLGLAISRLLVQMMKGQIWVESDLGKGSTFFFTVCLEKGQEEELEDQVIDVAPLNEAVLPTLSVLLVEDNEINQQIACEILKDLGLTVLLANNGVEAVNIWEQYNVDLILMDIQMPIMDGLMASRTIRSSPSPYAKKVPIIAMTANAMSGDKEKSLEAGMNEHITKPLDINKLRRALIVWGGVGKTEKEKINRRQ